MKTFLYGKKVILGVSGGIAIYKSLILLRALTHLGAKVKVVMTKSATKFINPMIFEVLSSNKVFLDLFEESINPSGIPHIDLADSADVVVLAPATANIIAKIAAGIADDILSTLILAATCPVMVCPSMNSNMYENPVTQNNLDCIRKINNYYVLSPGEGELACGVSGSGRLPEPDEIVDRLVSYLTHKDLKTQNILITAGPTQELIDPVRFISNLSSGKMGYSIARAAENRGGNVTLISGPVDIKSPINVNLINVVSSREMEKVVFEKIDNVDIIIKVAAVSDYSPDEFVSHKIKKNRENIKLRLKKNPDILKKIGAVKQQRQVLVGFAAETCDIIKNARRKLISKNLDMVVANFVGSKDYGFSSDINRVSLLYPDYRVEHIDIMDKNSLAHLLLDRIIDILVTK